MIQPLNDDAPPTVRVLLTDGFHDFKRGTLGGTPVVVDSMGRPYTAPQLADFVALMTALAAQTEARARAGDALAHRDLPGVWDALARGEAAAALLAPVGVTAERGHQTAVSTAHGETICSCTCGARLQTNAVPCSDIWTGLVRGFVHNHHGATR